MFFKVTGFLGFALALLLIPLETTLLEPKIDEEPQQTELIEKERTIETLVPVMLTFVGDIMLGRAVERRMQDVGISYPFKNVEYLFADTDLTIANFEGVVSEEHVQTPSMGFQFSIRNEYLTHLKYIGFDVLSLANNHSYDYGETALMFTRNICKEISLACIGSPIAIDSSTFEVQTINNLRVGFIFLNAVSQTIAEEKIKTLFETAVTKSDTQIVFIHWGDEYELLHNDAQQKLAETLIDAGADAVIGHHPHVVQDIAIYKNKPIFYSLGNFIFDQYFSEDVQEGLVVKLSLSEAESVYTLIPVTSKETRNQPQRMDQSKSKQILSRILNSLSDNEKVNIGKATITFKHE